ncbi:cytochrome c biogenesis CcdA family protein [Devosia sediminis]|uniref:Cytochrome c biogenesis protein CcdA n=1 Tax=Devosia sediminis TaxID=2798801 RepID=A0A934IYX5_9HYPH|nr:cytochrome c biogenesis CcdA family protein [Devosia sediminis]MBJ3784775.1 cytochrome c biogenesis protein CcdA [Devosia sediminis]
MDISILIAFAAGVVTVASPCVLPLLPVILASSAQSGRLRPWGVLTGFVLTFSAVTLALASVVNALGISPDIVRTISAVLLIACGVVLLVPKASSLFERSTGGLANATARLPQGDGFGGGFVIGAGLGLAWTPCVGPVMASVLTLAMNQQVTVSAVFVTLAFSLGTALPMVAVIFGGRAVLQRFSFLQANGDRIKKVFGVLLILVGAFLLTGFDRTIQLWLYDLFPTWEETLTGWEYSFVN